MVSTTDGVAEPGDGLPQKRLSSMDSATFAADADGVVAAGELVVNQETALTPASAQAMTG